MSYMFSKPKELYSFLLVPNLTVCEPFWQGFGIQETDSAMESDTIHIFVSMSENL
jgi:hypothetical protein